MLLVWVYEFCVWNYSGSYTFHQYCLKAWRFAWILIALKSKPEFGEAMRKSILLKYSLYLIKANKT